VVGWDGRGGYCEVIFQVVDKSEFEQIIEKKKKKKG